MFDDELSKPPTMSKAVIDMINSLSLGANDLHAIHRHVGDLVGRRMFYQLRVTVPWEKDSVHFDHTDRFEEVLRQLEGITTECLNRRGAAHVAKLPRGVFLIDADCGKVMGIRKSFLDEDTIANAFAKWLGLSYRFEIDQHEVCYRRRTTTGDNGYTFRSGTRSRTNAPSGGGP